MSVFNYLEYKCMYNETYQNAMVPNASGNFNFFNFFQGQGIFREYKKMSGNFVFLYLEL